MLGENANKIYHIYKAMVVRHICNRILGIPSPRYPGNKIQILMLIKVEEVYRKIVLNFANKITYLIYTTQKKFCITKFLPKFISTISF